MILPLSRLLPPLLMISSARRASRNTQSSASGSNCWARSTWGHPAHRWTVGGAAMFPVFFVPARARPSPRGASMRAQHRLPAERAEAGRRGFPRHRRTSAPVTAGPSPLSPQSPPETHGEAGGVKISIRGMRKTFLTRFGRVEALETLDLDVRDGELCVLVGPSGCGKSTLLRILAA